MPEVVVIGIGNPIKSDDGVGVEVVRRLDGRVGPAVELVEGNVYCADLFTFLEGVERAIFIDGVDAGEEPGSIFRLGPRDIKAKTANPLSIHDFGLYELINTARLMGQCPEHITILAVQVKDVGFGDVLSREVAAAVPRVCELVLEEIGDGGFDVSRPEGAAASGEGRTEPGGPTAGEGA